MYSMIKNNLFRSIKEYIILENYNDLENYCPKVSE